MGILSVLLWTPIVGALVVSLIPNRHTNGIRWLTNLVAAVALLLSAHVIASFDQSDTGFQFSEYFPLNPRLGSSYALGIDGISAPLLGLVTLLISVALLASKTIISRVKGYHICILLLEFGMLGVFLARDWLIFFIFWELTLIPLFFLINRWGGVHRYAASLNFVVYTMGGTLFIQLSILAVFHAVPGHVSLMEVMNKASAFMPKSQQIIVFLGFLIGFGVKIPLFPLHGWLPLAHVEAPSPVSILLSGALLKMGAYGLLRVVTMLPDAAHTLQPLLVFLALFGMVYGGLLAWRQSDLKCMVAYSSVSHMGIVLLGISTFTQIGITGAVLQMLAHGLIAGGLFLLVGLLYERTHTREIRDYSGLVHVMPRFTLFMTLTLFAAMGLPGTVGFIAEMHTLIAGFQQWPKLMAIFMLSMLIGATYVIRTITQLFTGRVKNQLRHIVDLHSYELMAVGVLALGIVGFGILPASLIELSAATIGQLQKVIGQNGFR